MFPNTEAFGLGITKKVKQNLRSLIAKTETIEFEGWLIKLQQPLQCRDPHQYQI